MLVLRSDPHLIARIRAGDVSAFEVVYERHLPGILSFCRHMLGSREEAEDAVQQVFASAHSHLQGHDRDIDFKPWLYAVARNRCLSMLRARRDDEHASEVEVSTAGLHEDVERRADLRNLLSDLGDLPETQRAALVLTELQALTHEQVAQVLDCDTAGVKGLVFRARSGLIERREAREASCHEIRAELATARGGAFRRGRLRHHLGGCPSCTAFLEDLRRQRKMMALVLPVVPSVGLKGSVLGVLGLSGGAGAAGVGAGASATAGGGLAAGLGGGAPLAATLAKVGLAGALAAGGGVAGHAALENDRPSRPDQAPSSPARGREVPGSPASAPASGAASDRNAGASGGARGSESERAGASGAGAVSTEQGNRSPGVRRGVDRTRPGRRVKPRAGERGSDRKAKVDGKGRRPAVGRGPKVKPVRPSPPGARDKPRSPRRGDQTPPREPARGRPAPPIDKKPSAGGKAPKVPAPPAPARGGQGPK